ncbi:hypothetical protein PMI15_04689 [Polaromonas sp. CF318]|uniref:hypothetical protein n=1 Tax=Polaromonas sp. CF318 TaxID=1144318 RepID=UPI0002714526|nr:hypothetical protein [Polaromonas sp. CF318]EJL77367.1 hypothetical protein PMI15_04689 [Polaromonas sp. CF318]
MDKNRKLKVFEWLVIAAFCVGGLFAFSVTINRRGECFEKVVDGKIEKVYVRNRLYGWPSEVYGLDRPCR